MFKNTWTLLFLLATFFDAIRPAGVAAADIVYPWRATSVIVQAGDGFCILFNNIDDAPIDSIKLTGPFKNIALIIDSIRVERYEYDSYTHRSVNNRIWVRAPRSTPDELYTLLIHSGAETHVSPKSVKVINRFKPTHCFIHISDLHVSRQWQGTAEKGYAKELELLDGFIKVANILAPDFIIITGDNIHHYTRFDADATGWGGRKVYAAEQRPLLEEKYRTLFSGAAGFAGLHALEAPIFLTTGNHDFYGISAKDHMAKASQWNELCGLRVYGFRYGETRVLAADDFLGDPQFDIPERSPMSGLQGQTLSGYLQQNGLGKLRILAQHRPDRVDTSFIDRHKINILLCGHRHDPFEEYVGATPTLRIRPGTVCKSGVAGDWRKQLGFFRVFFVTGDSCTVTPALRFCENPTDPYTELKLNLVLNYSEPNTGAAVRNAAVLQNRLPVDLPACKIRFVMKKGEYVVGNGSVEQVQQTDQMTIIDVRTLINSGEKKTVTIDSKSKEE